ncbi:hypothetical protein [Coprobacter tertius]|uniref:TPM domain-containing protein n=1 Tax=Coprobacter tertius TaxID=2944915 RepID=A0ABT1MJ24_9BACT|nr:hypothetical protein [Coprobacter tertius]MCP9612618.1 hypothetical protein [Coprobacter tertius]
MKKQVLLFFVLFLSAVVYADGFEIPKNYKFEKESDYAAYEKDIIDCVDWLIATPVNEQVEKRQKAYEFLLLWTEGAPKPMVVIFPEIVQFTDFTDGLVIFVGGWVRYSLKTRDFEDRVAAVTAGLEAVNEFYTLNKDRLQKDDRIEKYIKLQKKGKLKKYVQKNIPDNLP